MIRSLVIGILSVGALAACASSPSRPAVHTASAHIPPGWCATADGKALRPGSIGCDSLSRTYSGAQLRATGETRVVDALRMLDPDITVVRAP
jgi:hypothetical protein